MIITYNHYEFYNDVFDGEINLNRKTMKLLRLKVLRKKCVSRICRKQIKSMWGLKIKTATRIK